MKPGTEYELYVKKIYHAIFAQEGIDNICVQHDVKLTGAANVKRQVDLYWEFRVAGVVHKVVVECKDHKRPVDGQKIDAFHSKLIDLGATGVFITKNGFQQGAKDLAKKYGIQLLEMRHPTEKDWEGRVRNIVFDIRMRFLHNCRPCLKINADWLKAQDVQYENGSGFYGQSDEAFVEDRTTGTRESIESIVNRLSRRTVGINIQEEVHYTDAYFCTRDKEIKIDGIIFTYDVTEAARKVTLRGDDSVMAIIKYVLEGKTQTLQYDGSIIER